MILHEANSTAGILWRPAADQKLQSAFFGESRRISKRSFLNPTPSQNLNKVSRI